MIGHTEGHHVGDHVLLVRDSHIISENGDDDCNEVDLWQLRQPYQLSMMT